jgi:hypothetical protein
MQTAPPQIEPLLSPEQVSKIFDIQLTTLTKWRTTNKVHGLPFVRIGGAVRYQKEDVERFIRSNICMGEQPDQTAVTLALNGNPLIRSLASRCADATMIMVRKTSYAKFLRAAVALVNTEGTTPEQWLRDQLVAIQADVDAFDAWSKQDDENFKAKAEKVRPLLIALMHFETGITSSRDKLREQIRGFAAAQDEKIKEGRKGGLTMAEMKLLGRFDPLDEPIEKLQSQLSVIDAQLAQIATFSADPLKSTLHLVGLDIPGFDFTPKAEPAGSAV